MKIVVTHEDGMKEVLTLADPIQVIRGTNLNRLVAVTGMEHFFTQDGYYDGFGRGSPAGLDPDDALHLATVLDGERELLCDRCPWNCGDARKGPRFMYDLTLCRNRWHLSGDPTEATKS